MVKICKHCKAEFKTDRSKREYCSQKCSNAVIARDRENKKIDYEIKTVWSCGGGVQSTAIAALIYTGKLPKPDYAVMCDCGYERTDTWDYVYNTLMPKLAEIGVNLNILKSADYYDTDIIDKSGHVCIPAYGMRDGKVIKFNTHCNGSWKSRVTQRWLREQGVQSAENWIGISADEARRQRKSPLKWFSIRYPLIEIGMTREDCLYFIGGLGWEKPEHTSCFMCPQQSDAQWIKMRRESPADFKRAVEAEKYIHTKCPDVFLHRSMRPLDEAFNGG